jgi:hypothetical protein
MHLLSLVLEATDESALTRTCDWDWVGGWVIFIRDLRVFAALEGMNDRTTHTLLARLVISYALVPPADNFQCLA